MIFKTLLTAALLGLIAPTVCAADEPRLLVAARAKHPPVIDGKLDDACWAEGAPADGFSIFSDARVHHPEQTIGRICFDDDYLYFAAECAASDPMRFANAVNAGVGRFEDSDYYRGGGTVELFLDPEGRGESFQQYLLHANGLSRLSLGSGNLLEILNQDFMTVRTSLSAKGFNTEVAIPLAMLHLKQTENRDWGLNITRCHELYLESLEPDRLYSAWSSTRGQPFQNPKLFGRLRVAVDPKPFCFDVEMIREPEVGDDVVTVRVANQTSEEFQGQIALQVERSGGSTTESGEAIALRQGERNTIRLKYPVTVADEGAKYRLTITDKRGRIRYLGGTQKIEETPADAGSVPTFSEDAKRVGYQLFGRQLSQPVHRRSVPVATEFISELSLSAAPGQWEATSFCIYPIRKIASLKLRVSDLKSNSMMIPAEHIEIRQMTFQTNWKDLRRFESIEHLLRQCGSIDLRAGSTERVVLIAHVPDATAPGAYHGELELWSDGLAQKMPITLNVLPIELAMPDGVGYFMYFPGVNSGVFGGEAFYKKVIADMRDHGMTTMTLYHNCESQSADGRSQIDVDNVVDPKFGVTYARMLEWITKAGLGQSAPLIDVSAMRMARDPRLLAELQKIYRDRNWPRVAFYIEDEIDLPERIERARKMLAGLKAVLPDALTATALGDRGADALGHLYDIWIGCSRPELLRKCLEMGKQPWTYSCRPLNEISPAYVRFFYGRFVWASGLRGVGLWSYAEDSSFIDRFGRTHLYTRELEFQPDWKQLYGHVVFERDEIVPVVTWEAVRQGINDYRYLITLEKLIREAKASRSPDMQQAAAEGQKLLYAIRAATDLRIGADDLKYGRDWQAVGDLSAMRKAVIDAILTIRNAQGRN